MPQQLPTLLQEQQAQSPPLHVASVMSSMAGRDSTVSFRKESRASVSAASIASARRALLPPRAGISAVVPSPKQRPQHGGNGAAAGPSKEAAPVSRVLVPVVKAVAAATAISSIPLSTPLTRNSVPATASAPSSHLEYVGLGPSLARDSYLPHVQGSHAHDSASTGADVLALQAATTGLFARHIRLNSLPDAAQDDADGDDAGTAVPRGGDNSDAASPIASPTLVGTAPVKSAALLETGVDDRINPFLLNQLIQRSHRRARSTAAAAGKRGAHRIGQLQDWIRKPTFLKTMVASPRLGGDATGIAVDSAAAELRYHELPAIQEASEACYTAAPGNGGTGGGTTSTAATQPDTGALAAAGTKQVFNLIAEYNDDLDAEETPQAFAPGMSSTEHVHIAAAVSANDGALVRQLVGYYCARAEAVSPTRTSTRAAVVEAPTRASMRSYTTLKGKNAKTASGTTGGGADEGGAASSPFPFTSAAPNFSLLDAVMCVSREFVAQRSAAGVPGQSTSALSERRRCLLERLTSLDQTRIPETWWVTSLQYLGRLATTTGTGSSTATSAVTAAEKTQRASSATASMFATPVTENRPSAPPMSRSNRTGRSGGIASPPPVEGDALARPDESGSEAGTGLRNGLKKAAVMQAGPVSSGTLCGSEGQLVLGAVSSHNTIFPAPRPVERSQVYLLAEVLDRMLRDPSHPQWLELLADPQVARYVLGDGDDIEGDDGQRRGSGHDTLDADLWGTPGEQRLFAYTDAATHVLEILDTGLAELVRQVASYCLERGALLDLLRQSTMDIASAHVHILRQVKQQAHADALEAQTLRKEKAQLQQELEAVQKALVELQNTHAELCTRVEPLQRKSDRLDELMARVAAKARRFETFRHDENAALLQVLKESITQSAGAALDNFFKEMHDLQARHSGLEEAATTQLNGVTGDAAGHSNGDGAASPKAAAAVEMPSVAAARSQALEQQQMMEQLYTESHRLLCGLQDMVNATNTLCGRLYDKMILADVSPAAKVATSRWASVARAVGAFERDKRHRQRVCEVFMEYCTSYRHKRSAHADLETGREGSAASSSVSRGGRHTHSYGEAFLVNDNKETRCSDSVEGSEDPLLAHSRPSALLSFTEEATPDEGPRRRNNSTTEGKEGVDIDHAVFAAGGVREKLQHEVVMTGAIITREDLEAMKATDCTVDEVNALFRKDFDMQKYLRGSWQQYVLERQQQEQQSVVAVATTTSGPGGKQTTVESTYMLHLPDVLQMLSDVQATLAEVTVRMNATAKSAVLEAGLQPPLEPPSHPEQPCPLCSRRDRCELERHRRREAMSRIARDLQRKMEAVEAKSRAAFTERDEALGEVRRLKMELQHSATVTPARGPAVIGVQQQQEMQPESLQGHRQQRHTSSQWQAAADSTVTVPSIHHVPAWSLGNETSSLSSSSSSAMTGVTGRSANSADMSTVILSQADKCTVPPIVSGAGVGASGSARQSHISFFGDARVGDSFTTVSYEESDQVGHPSIPSKRRSTAEMPKNTTGDTPQ
ncbi:Axonemal dynein light chain, putative [Leishmania donovani]|uniref:Axonemal dynein light chain, putative n=1 Tax=Leishmania donovani TaxID=5661 RepID=A0A3S5H6P1_LEIDO|nr:Axonemal dynein light chain, putative [Leishmania donovani]